MSTEEVDPRFANYQRDASLANRLRELDVYEESTLDGIDHDLDRSDYRVAVIAGRWHSYVVDALVEGALQALNDYGVADDQIDYVQAPGAYEFPLVAQALLDNDEYNAVIVLGVVIRGETPHFDYVAGECSRCLADLSMSASTPVGFGLLTVNNVEQALARSAKGESNKGREAVLAALEVADLQEILGDD